ncbi:MAG TPA: 2-oxo acid dehydrogenase subunit E2 [Roseiflexaceae bacterium]|nr:2-oxo acid dehydrogenase subunit E2 [Roseiflexaceae bacterium]
MSSEVVLPALPFGGDEITVVRWLHQPGDVVAPGEALLVAANGRVEVALPASAGGTLSELLAREGTAVRAGAAVARFATPQLPAPALRATPLARRIAAERGLDLATLAGSGPGGCVMKRDVLGPEEHAAATSPAPPAAPVAAEPPVPALPVTQPTAAEAKPDIDVRPTAPLAGLALDALSTHILTAVEVDLGAAEILLARQNGRRGAADLLACVAQGAVAALLRFPLLNAAWHDDGIVARRRVHLGVRRARDGQTIALTIPDAQDLNLRGLARALAGRVQPDQPRATFTIVAGDNWGATPAPPAGQSALLHLGAVAARPVVVGTGAAERISIRPTALLTLAFDARILDQRQADAYLAAVRHSLEQIV